MREGPVIENGYPSTQTLFWQIRTIWDLRTPGQDEDILWTVFCLAFFGILSWQSVMKVHLIITAQLMMKNLAVDDPSNPSNLYQPFPEHLLLLSQTSVSSVGKEKQRALLLASRNQVVYHCCDWALIWPISLNQQKYAAAIAYEMQDWPSSSTHYECTCTHKAQWKEVNTTLQRKWLATVWMT